MKHNNFTNQNNSIVKFVKEGVGRDDVEDLYQNPLICGTVRLDGKKYWLWAAITEKDEYLKLKKAMKMMRPAKND